MRASAEGLLTPTAGKRTGAWSVSRIRQTCSLSEIVALLEGDAMAGDNEQTRQLLEDRTDMILRTQLEWLQSIKDSLSFQTISARILGEWEACRSRLPFGAHIANTEITSMSRRKQFPISCLATQANNKEEVLCQPS